MNADDFLVRLGVVIRGHRLALKLSQEAFADKIGTNRAYYGDVERGTRNLTMRSLHRIAHGLGLQVPELCVEVEVSHDHSNAHRTKPRRKHTQ